MGLHHVTQDPNMIKVVGSTFNITVFHGGDLDVAHIFCIHQMTQNGVGVTQGKQIADGLLAQVVIQRKI